MGAAQDWGKVINAEERYVQLPDNSEVVKIFRDPLDDKFYYKKFDGTILPLVPSVGGSLWKIAGSGIVPLSSTSTAAGVQSLAEGQFSNASGNYSHAEGQFCTASGGNSHAEGRVTSAKGNNSHAGGITSEATRFAEWARSSVNYAQYGIISFGNFSIDDVPTLLNLGDGNNFQPPSDSFYSFKFNGVGINTNGDTVKVEGDCTIKNLSGVVTMSPFSNLSFLDAGPSLVGCTGSLNSNVTSLLFEVQGTPGSQVKWFIKADYTTVKL